MAGIDDFESPSQNDGPFNSNRQRIETSSRALRNYSGSASLRRLRTAKPGRHAEPGSDTLPPYARDLLKERIKRMLREGRIDVLVCSDAAGEGLNLQTCGVLINYDLPWNPMKVEQRIGRIDRIGQKYTRVRIVNLAYADTVEADVYFALSNRIDLFQGVVGKLQPILSRLPREFETAVLRKREERERARQEAVYHVASAVEDAKAAPFNIDEVSEADLTIPEFPRCPLAAEDVEAVLRDQRVLPVGVECRELDPRTFSMTVPGRSEPLRVMVAPDLFEVHFESHQLAVHDSPVFRELVALSGHESVTDGWREAPSLGAVLAGRSTAP